MREAWVGFKADHLRVHYGLEFLCCHGTKLHGDHEVHLAVALQDGEVLVPARRLRGQTKPQTVIQLNSTSSYASKRESAVSVSVPKGNSCGEAASS